MHEGLNKFEPPEHESLFLLLYDYGAEKQQQRDLAKEVNVEVDAFRADGRLCVVKEVFPDVKGNVRNVEVKVMNSSFVNITVSIFQYKSAQTGLDN